MRLTCSTFLMLAGLLASPALAQDADDQYWSGFYAGVVGGMRTDLVHWQADSFLPGGILPAYPATAEAELNAAGLRLGGTAGYNFRLDALVLGIEAQAAWAATGAAMVGIPGSGSSIAGLDDDQTSVANGFDGSIVARVGVVMTPDILVFATAGVSAQQFSRKIICDGTGNSYCAAGPYREQTNTNLMIGAAAGLGAEVHLNENWIGRIEYRYADYGTVSDLFLPPFANISSHSSLRTHTLSVGLLTEF